MLTIALPKGRVGKEALDAFSRAFGREFGFAERKLILDDGGLRFLQVRNQDVPAYVYHQAADVGVVGLDVLEEQRADLVRLLDMGIGRCRVSVGARKGEGVDFTKPQLKVATKMENIARDFFSKKAVPVEIVKLYGSIELAPLVGLADVIVDIVETGETMRQNGLEPVIDIMESSAYLVANKNSFYAKKAQILDLREKLERVCRGA